MCLLTFQWQPDSPTPLVLVANRDEFHQRPTAPAQFWPEHPHVLAGKDLFAGGTWLGVTPQGHFAMLTNVRQMPSSYKGNTSRGALVLDYLANGVDPQTYLANIAQQGHDYDGFNLIVGNRDECWFYSNRQPNEPYCLSAGLYGLSNATLDTPWPKLTHAKGALAKWLSQPRHQQDKLHKVLHNRASYPAEQLPDTGIGEPFESLLSAAFIVSEGYGTRATTTLIMAKDRIHFEETRYNPQGESAGLDVFDF